jgi:hypothetical protein
MCNRGHFYCCEADTAERGDTIQVTVHNNITGPEDGTSLHWHGVLQKETPWMDGVPGVQQCPIPSGKSFTYTFSADLFGTGWYHSHFGAQYADVCSDFSRRFAVLKSFPRSSLRHYLCSEDVFP